MGSSRLLHKGGPMQDKVLYPHVSLVKRLLKPCRTISCVYSTVISLKGQLLLTNSKVIEFMHWWTLSLVGNQFINLKRCMMNFIQSKAKRYAFILHNLYFLFCFFSKIWVPGWARVVKMWLNRRTAKHFTKFRC